ncbi:ATP cone domain-containing protein [Winogradskyella aurantia]|uniref:ATPase n=1 Tax=Winogradskyella aurantia TaxID=1915063 RepID=A0A265UWN1_9FLAO|nr:ATP cone domain-containing protein [Winogradskyella aurantia]OZV69715.1 ATPase [Winogradskyella aurantia]
MTHKSIEVIKSSGKRVKFSLSKLRSSLKRSGASKETIDSIIDTVRDELYQGISTNEIYNRAFALLKKKKSSLASRYKLKKAIYELGPTGFPFERFIKEVLSYSGYTAAVGEILQGKCVSHEIDVIAHKGKETTIVECKFHREQGLKCDVKVPLYIQSRFKDVEAYWVANRNNHTVLTQGWVVTNTRFTEDAIQYGRCCGLYLLSWDYPKGESLRDRIDQLGLYPITVSTLLTNREKQFLLSRNVVLCRQLIGDAFYLDHLGVSDTRKEKILNEIQNLCNA